MKKTLLLFSALLCAVTLFAQPKNKKGETTTPAPATTTTTETKTDDGAFQLALNTFRQSLKYADFSSAAFALNQVIVLKPEVPAYKDTLAFIYVELGGNVQALSVAKDILATNPNNASILEVSAMSQESLGLYKEALEDYEKLFKLTNKPYHMYKIASMQYVLKRFGECTASINGLLKSTEAEKEKITINMDRGQRQEVPMKAALYNMLGMVAYEVNDMNNAKLNFNEALKLEPNFVLAKGNLDLVSRAENEQKGKTTTPATNQPKTGTAPKTGK